MQRKPTPSARPRVVITRRRIQDRVAGRDVIARAQLQNGNAATICRLSLAAWPRAERHVCRRKRGRALPPIRHEIASACYRADNLEAGMKHASLAWVIIARLGRMLLVGPASQQ